MNTTSQHYLDELRMFFADTRVCRDCFQLVMQFSVRLAAVGRAAEVLDIVERSPEKELYAPLAGGLRLHLGRTEDAKEANGATHEVVAKIKEAATEFPMDQLAVSSGERIPAAMRAAAVGNIRHWPARPLPPPARPRNKIPGRPLQMAAFAGPEAA